MCHIGTTITLDFSQQCDVRIHAHERTSNNRKCNVQSRTTPERDFEIDLQGFGGEYAFCLLFGLIPDTSIYPRSGKLDKGDCVLDGKNIDVKTREQLNRDLIVPYSKKNADIYAFALMVGKFPTYTFKGFMTRDEIFLPERRIVIRGQDFGIGYQEELTEFSALWLYEGIGGREFRGFNLNHIRPAI